MRIFNGPGMLLNPAIVQNVGHLGAAFGQALASRRTNMCALVDEAGAIAHAMGAGTPAERDAGESIFAILESGRPLAKEKATMSRHLSQASAATVRRAIIHARRYFRPIDADSDLSSQLQADEELARALLTSATQAEAARRVSYSRTKVCLSIAHAPYESPLAIFKGAFGRAGLRHADEAIAALRGRGMTYEEIARELGYAAASSVWARVERAPNDSPLAQFKKKGK